MKSVVAFANGKGGRIVFGVDDGMRKIVGISKEVVFSEMDARSHITLKPKGLRMAFICGCQEHPEGQTEIPRERCIMSPKAVPLIR